MLLAYAAPDAMTAVTLAGFVLGITRTEWTVVILCFGVVIAAELFNTAIERLVDLVSPERATRLATWLWKPDFWRVWQRLAAWQMHSCFTTPPV